MFPALRYTGNEGEARPVRWRLDEETTASLAAAMAGPRPAAWVLRNADIARLTGNENVRGTIVDRGTKHPRKQLAAVLLGYGPRIPLIRGSYRSAGRLEHGVRILLSHAARKREHQAYLIGVDDSLFDELWAAASAPSAALSGRTRRADGDTAGSAVEESALGILDGLPPLEVPPALEQRYIGMSPSIQLVRQLIVLAARVNEPVLILGETGTGKEVVARAIHDHGARRSRPFIAVNCGAIPAELFESELFGHVAGAFTGAVGRRTGLWQLANRGTLFLDEIGDLRPDHQAKILRALEARTIRPVGGEQEITVDVRIIAATNRELYAMVRAGEYREDLYYRLRSFLIRTPSLREHPADIPDLAEHFWRKLAGDSHTSLTAGLLADLRLAAWPGNARELRSVLAQLHAVFSDVDPTTGHLRTVNQLHGQALQPATPPHGRARGRIGRLRRREMLLRLEDVLRACRVTLQPLGRRTTGPTLQRVGDALRRRIDELRRVVQGRAEAPSADGIAADVLEASQPLRRNLVRLAGELEVDPAAARRSWRLEVKAHLDDVLATVERALAVIDQG
jgi:DNA-binding NtrC family response regulator